MNQINRTFVVLRNRVPFHIFGNRRISIEANHALSFMIRGIRKEHKQVVANYFVHNTITSRDLKSTIMHVIKETVHATKFVHNKQSLIKKYHLM